MPLSYVIIILRKEYIMNILLVEDNESIIKGLNYTFAKNNLSLIPFNNIKDATKYINEHDISLIILDITLPDGNGFNLYEDVIKKRNIPTIFLTAKDEEDDIVKGLEIGAEDYITKPFSSKELLARVNKVLLRNQKKTIIKIGDISYDLDKALLSKNNEKIELTALELKLVNLLFNNHGKVVSREQILDKIWEWTGNFVDDHTVTVYFNRIREKIGSDIIVTIKGMGYRIDEK